MGTSWKNEYLKKHGHEWGQKPEEEEPNQDYGRNVIKPHGTWKNPVDFGLQNFNEYGDCQLYFATRIETEESELVIEGWKTPENERVTMPLYIERDGKKIFTGAYKILGETEVKRIIPVGKVPYDTVLTILRELNSTSLTDDEKIEELVKKISCAK